MDEDHKANRKVLMERLSSKLHDNQKDIMTQSPTKQLSQIPIKDHHGEDTGEMKKYREYQEEVERNGEEYPREDRKPSLKKVNNIAANYT
jgi:hypothetical protein